MPLKLAKLVRSLATPYIDQQTARFLLAGVFGSEIPEDVRTHLERRF